MYKGRGAHRSPQVRDVEKQQIGFVLVPSSFGKGEGSYNYSARLTHNQVMDEDAVVLDMCEEFHLPKHQVMQEIQRLSDYLVSRIRRGYQVTFGGFTVGLAISGKFDAMNAEFDLERNKIEVVVSPRYELKDAVAYLKPVNDTKTLRPEIHSINWDGVPKIKGEMVIAPGKVCRLNGVDLLGPEGVAGSSVYLEDASGRFVAPLTYIEGDVMRIDFRLDAAIKPGSYRLVFRCMNAGRKSYVLARCNVRVV